MERKRRMNNKWRIWVLLLSAWLVAGSVVTGPAQVRAEENEPGAGTADILSTVVESVYGKDGFAAGSANVSWDNLSHLMNGQMTVISGQNRITPDGRYVAYVHYEASRIPGELHTVLSLYERSTGSIVKVLPDSFQRDVVHFAMTPDARWFAFSAKVNWMDSNEDAQVYVFDRQTGNIELISKLPGGGPAGGQSDNPSISADGRFVAFDSYAKGIVPGDTNWSYDVYVYDRENGTMEFISAPVVADDPEDSDLGFSENPSLSANGRYVAFESESGLLVSGDDNDEQDIFLYDRTAKQMKRISVTDQGAQLLEPSRNASISGDGRVVAFESEAADLVPGDTNDAADIFVYRQEGTIERVSYAPDGQQSVSDSIEPLISEDGRFVTYTIDASSSTEEQAMIADLDGHGTAPVTVTETDIELKLPSEDAVVSNGAEVAVFNSNYMTYDPQYGEYETIGLFVASKGVPPAWPAGSKLETSDVQTDRVTLTWTNATDAKGIKEYRIFKNDMLSTTVDASVLTHTVTGLEAGKAYVFRVEAVNTNDVMSTGGPLIMLRTPADDQTLDLTWRLERMTTDKMPVINSKLFITGMAKSGRNMQATVSYKTWLDEGGSRLPAPRTASMLIQMNETAQASGEYAGTFEITEGIAELTSLKATLSDGAGGITQREAAGWPLTVSGNLKIELDNPGNINTEGAYIGVFSALHSGKTVKVEGSGPITVEGLAPGEDYSSTLVSGGGREWSTQKDVRIYPGLNTPLTMSIPQEAHFRLKLIDQDGNAVPDIKVELWNGANTGYIGGYLSDTGGYTSWVKVDDSKRTFTARINLADTNYEPIPDQPIALKPGDNEISVRLQRSPTGILQGRVLDPTGLPVLNALVTTTQMYKGEPVDQQMYTGINGEYQFTLHAGEVSIKAAEVRHKYNSEEGLKTNVAGGETKTLDIPVKMSGQGVIVLKVYVKELGGDWQGPVDMEQRHFSSKVNGRFGGITSYYQNVIDFQGNPGEKVDVCVTGALHHVVTGCVNITLDSKSNGVAEVRLEETGALAQGQLPVSENKSTTYANLYELLPSGELKHVSTNSVKGRAFEVHAPKAGTYRLEFNRSNTVTKQIELAHVEFSIAERQIKQLGEITFHEARYFTQTGANGFMAVPNQVSPGGIVNLRAYYRSYGDGTIENARLKLDIPEGIEPVKDESGQIAVKVNGVAGTAVQSGGIIEIPLGSIAKKVPGTVSFQLKLDNDFNKGAAQLTARISGSVQTGAVEETLGYVQLDVPSVTLEVPDRVSAAEVAVTGLAPAGSRVLIYDSNMLLGTVDASAAGTWKADIRLEKLDDSGLHALWAETTYGGSTLQSEQKFVSYQDNQPILEEIAMAQMPAGKWIRLNVKNGIAQAPYTVVPGNPFKFQLKFTEPDKVTNVRVYMGGQIGGPVVAERGMGGVFQVTVPTNKGALGGIYVDYDIIKPKIVIDRTLPTDAEIRKSLPVEMQDFRIVKKTPFHQEGTKYTGNMVIEFPQIPGMKMTVTQTIELEPGAYRPTDEEILQAEKAGVPVYNIGFNVKEGEKDVITTMTGYLPKKELFPESQTKTAKNMPVHLLGGPLDDLGIDLGKYDHMVKYGTEIKTEVDTALKPVQKIKGNYKQYMKYAGRINKIMSNVEAATACPEMAETTGKQAGKALLVTVGGEVMRTALTAATGAMALEGPVGVIGGIATKYAINKMDQYVDEQIKAVGDIPSTCEPEEDNYDDPEEENIYKKRLKRVARMKWIYDPSGYVYEAVESNRLENVKATVLYKDPKTGVWTVWNDAESYDQINPQMTDQNGRYGWDVPAGEWKVVWEKAGYETASSAELTVPPPHFDVNAGLVSKVAPKVKTVTAVTYENGSFIDVIFDKYLISEGTLQENTITVKDGNGSVITGNVSYEEKEPGKDGKQLSRKLRFVPAAGTLTAGGEYEVEVRPDSIMSYSGAPMLSGDKRKVVAVVRDTRGPQALSASAHSSNSVIRIAFDEPLRADELLDPEKFEVAGLEGYVQSAVVDNPEGDGERAVVILTLSRPFAEGTAVTVKAQPGAVYDVHGNPSQEASVTAAGPNTLLSGLTVAGGTLVEPFSGERTEYTVKVSSTAEELQIKATMADPSGKLAIKGFTALNATVKTVKIPSDNLITVTVQAANHPEVVKEYRLVIERMPPASQVQFNAAAYYGIEESGTVTVKITRTGSTKEAATVQYATVSGTAKAGADFIAASGKLTFAPGETSKSVKITLLDDKLKEYNETFSMQLSSPTGAVISGPAAAPVSILDKDHLKIQG